MRISFDLDNTLIPYNSEFPVEKRNFLGRLLGVEKLRKGSIEFLKELQEKGHSVHVYTTSYRSKRSIRKSFAFYGIRLKSVVNEKVNRSTLRELNINLSKYPPAFNFDLHIDDAPGLQLEANNFKFRVLILSPNNHNWTDSILKAIQEIENK